MDIRTGNRIVDEIARWDFSIDVNVIPSAWYDTIRLENGKPDLISITILSDILYWYRPTAIREELTGKTIGYKPKIKGEFLQRSYSQIEDRFGFTEKQSREAIKRLEALGVVKRVHKDIYAGGNLLHNVQFLVLFPDRLRDITYPSGEDEQENIDEGKGMVPCREPYGSQKGSISFPESNHNLTKRESNGYEVVNTNTKTSKKISSENTTTIQTVMDGWSVDQTEEYLVKNIDDFLEEGDEYHLLRGSIYELITPGFKNNINGGRIPPETIIKYISEADDIGEIIYNTVEAFKEYTEKNEIKNPKAVMKAIFYNILTGKGSKIGAQVRYDLGY